MRKIIKTALLGLMLLAMLVSSSQAEIVSLTTPSFPDSLWNDDANAIAGTARNDLLGSDLLLGVTNLGTGESYETVEIPFNTTDNYKFTFDFVSSTGDASFAIYRMC